MGSRGKQGHAKTRVENAARMIRRDGLGLRFPHLPHSKRKGWGTQATLPPAVEAPEAAGATDRHRKRASAERSHLNGIAQAEDAHANHEQVSHDEVEESPQYVDGG